MTQRLWNFFGVGLLSIALSTTWLAHPASAQVDEGLGTNRVVQNDDDGFDWGWLGLLGLIGLAGLMRRDRDRDRHQAGYRDTATTSTATTPRT